MWERELRSRMGNLSFLLLLLICLLFVSSSSSFFVDLRRNAKEEEGVRWPFIETSCLVLLLLLLLLLRKSPAPPFSSFLLLPSSFWHAVACSVHFWRIIHRYINPLLPLLSLHAAHISASCQGALSLAL